MVAQHLRICRLVASLAFATALLSGSANPSGSGHIAEPPTAGKVHVRPQLLQPGDPRTHGLTDADLESLTAILRKAVDDHTVPGVSLLLAHKGKVVCKKSVGNLALDQKALVASSSKPVTATILMILVDQAKLSLDDPVERYLPEFKGITINGRPPAKLPTVRHLLCNMSGLPGDFLAESLLKRLRNGAGKAQDEIKTRRTREGQRSSPFRRRGKTLTRGFCARTGENGPGDGARSRLSLLHDGFQRGGPRGRSGGPTTVRRAEPHRAI